MNPNGQCDVEAIYVEVYTTRQSYCGLDAQIDIQVDDQDCYYVPTLQYSYKTNISTIVDFDIWNWETSSWDEIESVNNYDSFDDDYFTFLVEGRYVNATLGVRVRFQATASNHFQLEIDRLRLDYLADYS